MTRLRILFMGTADLAATVLNALLAAQAKESDGTAPRQQRTSSCAAAFEVIAAVSQPDKPKGRDLKLQPTPVKEIALRHQIPVLQPAKARDPQFIEQLRTLKPDLIVVAAYGQILPQALLDIPPYGCVNVHTSILPKYRGAAPIQWAILNGEFETGVTIMKMDAGLDTGPVLNVERTPILATDNGQTLHDRLAQIGGALLVRTIPAYVAGEIKPEPQPSEGVSHARKIAKQDGKLDWTESADTLWNKVRGLTPWPGAFTFVGDPTPLLLKIWRAEPLEGSGTAAPGTILSADKTGIVAACGTGSLRILELQREGGKRLSAQQFLAGHAISINDRFGKVPAA